MTMGDPFVGELESHDLPCPFCKRGLRHPDGWAGLDQDSNGVFVHCRHCNRRVAMERIPMPEGAPSRWRVARRQPPDA